MRSFSRGNKSLRKITLSTNYMKNSDGSCLVEYGNTKVICSATVENNIPKWLEKKGCGWITAEYSMLPTATSIRTNRESVTGKQSGRTQEIQRLIGRSLRATSNLYMLGERQIKIDCDVISADGGTRTASITGSCVSLEIAYINLIKKNLIKKNPLLSRIVGISCGILNKEILLDLDFFEDSKSDVDANFVLNEDRDLIEVQCSGEKGAIKQSELIKMINLVKNESKSIFLLQKNAIELFLKDDTSK